MVLYLLLVIVLINLLVSIFEFIFGCRLYVVICGDGISLWVLLINLFLWLLLKKKVMCVYFFVLEICSCVLFCFFSYLFNIFVKGFGVNVIGVLMFVVYLVIIIKEFNLGDFFLLKLLKLVLIKVWVILCVWFVLKLVKIIVLLLLILIVVWFFGIIVVVVMNLLFLLCV